MLLYPFEYFPEPEGIIAGVQLDVLSQVIIFQIFKFMYFKRIYYRKIVWNSGKNMVKFIFRKIIIQYFFVRETKQFNQVTLHPHFLSQAAVGSIDICFSGQRMAAAGIWP